MFVISDGDDGDANSLKSFSLCGFSGLAYIYMYDYMSDMKDGNMKQGIRLDSQ